MSEGQYGLASRLLTRVAVDEVRQGEAYSLPRAPQPIAVYIVDIPDAESAYEDNCSGVKDSTYDEALLARRRRSCQRRGGRVEEPNHVDRRHELDQRVRHLMEHWCSRCDLRGKESASYAGAAAQLI